MRTLILFAALLSMSLPQIVLGRDVHFPLCGAGKRVTCVVDGDTFWLGREKFRLAGIDTPEASRPRCAAEAHLADKATLRLQSLLNGGAVALERQGQDRYGRTLVDVRAGGQSVERVLVAEGLAQHWRGRKANWC